jgi:hypothetical protein
MQLLNQKVGGCSTSGDSRRKRRSCYNAAMPSERDKARSKWQITVRELLFCTLVVALALGWLADRKRLEHKIQRQQDALQSMAKENVLLQLKLKRVFGDEWSQ